jgi:tetratricopeptide (TPR) repeat protein
MKKLFTFAFFLAVSGWAMAQTLSQPPSGGNQKSEVVQYIGPAKVTITYSSPDVHSPTGDDRKGHIWGELVPYGFFDQGFGTKTAPWRAGANQNTTITFSDNVKVEGKELKAGTYGLFIVTDKSGPWTWIFSNNATSWGSFFYNPAEDALRVTATPQDAPYTEWLTYGFEERLPASTTAYLQWENKRLPLKIELPNANDIYVSLMRNELRSTPGFDYRNFSNAAVFCAQNKINLEEALTWADQAMSPTIGGQEDFTTLQAKSQVLTAMNKDAESDAVMDKAIKLPTATVLAIHQYGRSLLTAGKKDKAMEVFKYNATKHPEEKFTPNVGLARGYTALGDKKNAIKYWELAIKNLPDNQKPNLKFYQSELDKLKAGA